MTMLQVQDNGSSAEHQQSAGIVQDATPPQGDNDLSSSSENEWDDDNDEDMKDAATLS